MNNPGLNNHKLNNHKLNNHKLNNHKLNNHKLNNRKLSNRKYIDKMFRKHADDLFRYLRSFRLPEDETYELVQATFVKLVESDIEHLKSPKAWLFTVGRNMAFNKLKRNKFNQPAVDTDTLADNSAGALANLLINEENTRLYNAFKQLGTKEQEIFRLHLDQGLSYREIAAIVDKSEGAIRVLIHRSREKLKQILNMKSERSLA